MVARAEIIAQLKNVGVTVKSWGAAEVNELPHILMPGEQITNLIHGWYENGFATLVTTSQRLLLIDKKLFTLVVEDVRYDMIAEVDYNVRLLDATVCINTINKKLMFSSLSQRRLRNLTKYVQFRVMELRQHYSWKQFEETPAQASHEPVLQGATVQPMAVPSFGQAAQITSSLQPFSPYTTKPALTSKQYSFLPKIPRRWRP